MTKRTDKKSNNSEQTDNRVCRVSYSLNNDQPVRSTIIGDQPLFYMDFEDGFDDDFFDPALLEDELSLGSDRFSMHDIGPGDMENSAEKVLEAILDESAFITGPASAGRADARSIAELLAALGRSRYGAALIENARSFGVAFRLCAQEHSASYVRESNEILIGASSCREDQILLLGRELRRQWQHRSGVLLNPLTFHPDQAILVNRAQVADLVATMIRLAWELQLDGNRAVWERLEDSSMADLARVFAREAFLDFRTLNNGMAMATTFEMWFLTERCRPYDKQLIQQMLTDYNGYVFAAEESSRALTLELISALGRLPFGKNYLAPFAAAIIADPVFADVRDRANANFLWFIKFEKSFRETEQELQSASGPAGRASQRASSRNCKGSADATSENIIAFPREKSPASRDAGKVRAQNASQRLQADVIVLSRWSRKE